jgi:hypothetical protein
MEAMDGLVRSNLEQQLDLLQTRLRWNIVGVRIDAIFLMVLLEVVPYFQHYRMLDKWHSLAPVIRFGSYAGFLVIQYFVSKWVCQLKFGRHIDYLKGLLNEMQH